MFIKNSHCIFITHQCKEKYRINFKRIHNSLIVVTSEERGEFWRNVVRKGNCDLSVLLEVLGNKTICTIT